LKSTHSELDICFEGKILVQRVARPKKIPVNQVYKTIDAYAKDYHGYQKKNGKYGYMSNENAKWDWYELGGRWTGYFILKPGVSGIIGSPGLMTSSAKPGTADQALKKNVDFDAMYAKNFERASKHMTSLKSCIRKIQKKLQKNRIGNLVLKIQVEIVRHLSQKQERDF